MSRSAGLVAAVVSLLVFAGTMYSEVYAIDSYGSLNAEEINASPDDPAFTEKTPVYENENRMAAPSGMFSILASESGSNDACTSAQFFSYKTDTANGAISPSGDVDWWKFSADIADSYGMLMSTTGGDLNLYVYDSCGSSMACSSTTKNTNEFCTANLPKGDHFILAAGYGSATGNYVIAVYPRCDSDQCCWDKYGYCYAHCGNSGEPACSTAGSQASHCISKKDTSQGSFICSGACEYACPTDNDPNGIGGLDCCSCSCTSGACCNGCSFRPSTYMCSSNAGSETGCPWGNAADSDVGKRDKGQYCSGSSGSCSGTIAWSKWYLLQDCAGSYKNEYQCSGGMLQRKYTNAGCVSSSCQSLGDEWKNEKDCGSAGYCDGWGSNYCKNNDVYRGRTCHDKGCANSACYDNTRNEEQQVKDCGDSGYVDEYQCSGSVRQRKYLNNGCSSGACVSSSQWNNYEDCGQDSTGEWSGLQCIGGNVGKYMIITYKGCNSGSCYKNPVTETQTVETCQYGCENAECIKRPDLSVGEQDIIFERV